MKYIGAKYVLLLYIIVTLTAVVSCNKNILSYNFPANGDQIVTFANINPDSGIVVYLTKSFDPNQADVSETGNFLSGAEVILFKNDVVFDTLIESESGIYKNEFSLSINAGDRYFLIVNYAGSSITSDGIIMPDTIVHAEPAFTSTPVYDSLYHLFFIDFNIPIVDTYEARNYFGFKYMGQLLSGDIQSSTGYLFNYDYSYIESCLDTKITPSDEAEVVFSDKCFAGEDFNLQMKVEVGTETTEFIYNKIFINLKNYSPEYYNYLNQLFYSGNTGDGFSQYTSPFATYSNMSNGFGVFYAYNTIVIDRDL